MLMGPVYDALADSTRRRILHLLNRSPLCVCHFQAILGESQVKVSQHLAYLRQRRLVVAVRRRKWVIYSLPARPNRALAVNLHCLAACAADDRLLRRDLTRLNRTASAVADALTCAC
jgi:ArsR family transcriptional regulator